MVFEFGMSKAGFRITMSYLKKNLAQTLRKKIETMLKGYSIAAAKFQEIPLGYACVLNH